MRYIKNIDNQYYIITSQNRYILSDLEASEFGLRKREFTYVAKETAPLIKPGFPINKFMLNVDDGKIYYGSGGAIHYVSSMDSYLKYGGAMISPTRVNSSDISMFSIGLPI